MFSSHRKHDLTSLGRAGYAPSQLPFPAMGEGAVLNSLPAGQRVARKVLRAQVGTDLAVTTNSEVIRQVRTFANQCNASVQAGRLQLVRRYVIAVANLAVFANDHLLIQDRTINHAASTNDAVKEYDGVPHHCIFLDDHTWREHAALDLPLDDTAMRDQTAADLRATANVGGWPLFTASMNHPRAIIQVEGRTIAQQLHMRLPVGLHPTYILPVPCKGIGIDLFAPRDHARDNIFAKVMLA